MMTRTIVIGDIHGCYAELLDLLDRLAVTNDDRVIAVGDLVVKGTRHREALDLFINDKRFSSVVGNHDRALVRFWSEGKKLSDEQEACRRQLAADEARYAAYLTSLKPYIELGSHVVVHAGVRPGVALADQSVRELTTMRTLGAGDVSSRDGTAWYELYDETPFVLFGHWAASTLRRGRRALGLDTGCVYGGRLTAYIIEADEIVSVPAREAYSDYGRPLPVA